MKLMQETITEFQELYKKRFGVKLTFREAEIEAKELMNLYALSQNLNINHEE